MRHLLAALVLLAACAADPVIAPRDCTPGTTTSCACPGASGVQTCTAAGTVGACVCPDAGADVVAVGDAPDVPGVDVAVIDAGADVVAVADVIDAGAARDAVAVPDVGNNMADCGARYTFCPTPDAGPERSCINLADGTYRGQSGLSSTNCGACGRSCEGGRVCCGGRCFFPNEDLSDAGIPNCSRFP